MVCVDLVSLHMVVRYIFFCPLITVCYASKLECTFFTFDAQPGSYFNWAIRVWRDFCSAVLLKITIALCTKFLFYKMNQQVKQFCRREQQVEQLYWFAPASFMIAFTWLCREVLHDLWSKFSLYLQFWKSSLWPFNFVAFCSATASLGKEIKKWALKEQRASNSLFSILGNPFAFS